MFEGVCRGEQKSRNREVAMKKIHYMFGFYLLLLGLAGCVTTTPPVTTPPEHYISQAIWGNTTQDKVYSACLTALTIERFSLNPVGTRKSEGLIMSNRRSFNFKEYIGKAYGRVECYYTLQIVVTEKQQGKVAVFLNAVDAAYDFDGGDPGLDYVRPYMNNVITTDIKKLFEQLDILLGKAEYYQRDRSIFEAK